jgi:methionine biosynthesis protein MetW
MFVRDPTLVGLVHATLRRWEAHRTDVVSDLLRPGAALLDVGCGDGDLLKHNMHRFEQLHGIDIARNRVARAEAHGAGNILVRVGDIDAGLPYGDGEFDAVTCVAVLEHVFDPEALVRELVRVIKRHGQLLVEVPNVAFLPRRIGLLFGRLPRTAYNEPGWDGGHLHYFTLDAVEELLARNGVQVTSRLCSGIAHQLRSVRPQLLGADIIVVARKP